MSKFNAVMMGACTFAFGTFPAVWLVTAVYRFPAPMGGSLNGSSSWTSVVITVVIYGLLGGFPLLGAIGGVAGAMAHDALFPDDGAITKRILLSALITDLVVAAAASLL